MKLQTNAWILCVALLLPMHAHAFEAFSYDEDHSPWVLRGRIGTVSPEYQETYTPSDTTDGQKDILSSSYLLETEISYQISPRFSFASSLGYSAQTKEDITLSASGIDTTDNSKVAFVPASFILRFHPAPYGKLNPYLGIGLHHTFGFSTFSGAEMSNASGIALQAGVDYWFNNQYLLNIDFKQYTAEFDINYTVGENNIVQGTYTYDPTYLSIGLGARF